MWILYYLKKVKFFFEADEIWGKMLLAREIKCLIIHESSKISRLEENIFSERFTFAYFFVREIKFLSLFAVEKGGCIALETLG